MSESTAVPQTPTSEGSEAEQGRPQPVATARAAAAAARAAVSGRAPRALESGPPPAIERPAPLHRHPNNARYCFTCLACRAEDKARSGLNNPPQFTTPEELEQVIFLIPESDHDRSIVLEYINQRYPGAPYVSSQIDVSGFTGWGDGEVIVAIRRDTWPRPPRPGSKLGKDEIGNWAQVPVPIETFLDDIVEMAPIEPRKELIIDKATRFRKGSLDRSALYDRLSEVFPPPYRIDLPRHKDDTIMRIIHA